MHRTTPRFDARGIMDLFADVLSDEREKQILEIRQETDRNEYEMNCLKLKIEEAKDKMTEKMLPYALERDRLSGMIDSRKLECDDRRESLRLRNEEIKELQKPIRQQLYLSMKAVVSEMKGEVDDMKQFTAVPFVRPNAISRLCSAFSSNLSEIHRREGPLHEKRVGSAEAQLARIAEGRKALKMALSAISKEVKDGTASLIESERKKATEFEEHELMKAFGTVNAAEIGSVVTEMIQEKVAAAEEKFNTTEARSRKRRLQLLEGLEALKHRSMVQPVQRASFDEFTDLEASHEALEVKTREIDESMKVLSSSLRRFA